MKHKLIYTIIFFSSTILSHSAFSANKDSVDVFLSIPKKEIENSSDLRIKIEIKSNKIAPIIVPKEISLGYMERRSGFFRIQVQQEIDDKYVDVPSHGFIDNMPSSLDTMYKNDVRKFNSSFRLLYRFVKGNYRIRVLGAFSVLNHINDVYSDWKYFTCKKDIVIE
jgi:hypothetical protein